MGWDGQDKGEETLLRKERGKPDCSHFFTNGVWNQFQRARKKYAKYQHFHTEYRCTHTQCDFRGLIKHSSINNIRLRPHKN